MMLMPLTASVVLVRHERDLESAFSQQAPYLFHGNAGARNWDQGLRSFTCSRRIDALKVWVAIQRYGASGLGALYEHLCGTARAMHDAILARPYSTRCTCPSRTFCASDTWAIDRWPTIVSMR